MYRLYYHSDAKDNMKAGETVYNPNRHNYNRVKQHHQALFGKIGIKLDEVETIMETEGSKQHARMHKGLTILQDDPQLKEFQAAAKKYGFDKFFDDFDLDENQKLKMMHLFVGVAGDLDMDSFVRMLSMESAKRVKKGDLREDVLSSISKSNKENPVYNKQVYDDMPKAQQDYMKRLGIDYNEEHDVAIIETLIDNRMPLKFNMQSQTGCPYQMGIRHEDSVSVDVRVSR